jgi:hypothetical protein
MLLKGCGEALPYGLDSHGEQTCGFSIPSWLGAFHGEQASGCFIPWVSPALVLNFPLLCKEGGGGMVGPNIFVL